MTTTATQDGDKAGAMFALSLVDRRTGAPLRRGGAVLTIFTRTPEEATAEALRDRDASIWQVRIERLATVEAAARG
jgi:hypothetical protein